jgi:hypothetical protein
LHDLFPAGTGELAFVRGVKLNCIHNADNRGVHRAVFAMIGHARGTASH